MELPPELWKGIIQILTDPHQYIDDRYDFNLQLHYYIPLQLNILSSISKQFYKITQERLKIVASYVGEFRIIPLLKKTRSIDMYNYLACFGYLSLIKEARSLNYQWKENDICYQAAHDGRLDTLKYLHESGCNFDSAHIAAAAYSSTECLKYLRSIGCEWNHEACTKAASAASLERLKYLHENGCEWTKKTCNAAARISLECLAYAHENGCEWTGKATENAAKHGQIDILIYLHENGCPWGARTCEYAAQSNSLACLTYAHEHGAKWSPWVCEEAASVGSLECLKYAHENGCNWTPQTSVNAAERGSLDCLKYTIENGIPLSSDLYQAAARAGSLEIMQYLHQINCPIGPGICRAAIPNLNCLKYAFEVLAAPIDEGIELEDAAMEESEECLQYLIGKGVKWPTCIHKYGYATQCFAQTAIGANNVRAAKLALKYKCTREVDEGVCAGVAQTGDIYLLKYLHENGYPWDASTCVAAIYANSIECLQYAHANGCPWNSQACKVAAGSRSPSILKFLNENGCAMDADTIFEAADNKSFDCLKYAHENGCPWHEKTLIRAAMISERRLLHKDLQMTESVKILQFATERGCPLHPSIAKYAATTGNILALEWAYENKAEWNESVCIDATRNYQTECLEFIHSKGECPNTKCTTRCNASEPTRDDDDALDSLWD